MSSIEEFSVDPSDSLGSYEADFIETTVWSMQQYWNILIDSYLFPFISTCISIYYYIYLRLNITNVIMNILKCIPTLVFIFKFCKNVYIQQAEKRNHIKNLIEDLELQIINTKVSVTKEATEQRDNEVRRECSRLRRRRERVSRLVAADEELSHNLVARESTTSAENDSDASFNDLHSQEEHDIMMEIFKKADRPLVQSGGLESGEPIPDDMSLDNSGYTMQDVEAGKDCKVKIVRVTNVYKVAYLRKFIKQKHIRKANKQAHLKKRMDSVRKLFEDWQKSLSLVINKKLSLIKVDSQVEVASQEAMGDYSKPSLNGSSESEFEVKHSDVYENSGNWNQFSYRNSDFSFENGDSRDDHYADYTRDYPVKYTHLASHYPNEYNNPNINSLYVLPEETKSEIAGEEIKCNLDNDV